jgi:arylsulfatase A-like enzyme
VKRLGWLCLATLVALAHWRCGGGSDIPSAAPAERPNLVLVTIDTLRADRVGAYGHAAAETPFLDRLARKGVLLGDSVVQVPQTRPSHASILTGLQPWRHGIRDNFSPPLDESHTTLATRLAAEGYATGAFIGAYPVSRDSGLHRGFEAFDDPFSGASGGGLSLENSERRAEAVVDAALEWLGAQRRRPFLLWIHLFDPHTPYAAPAPFGQRFAKAPYDGEVAYADAQLGRVLEWLDREGETPGCRAEVAADRRGYGHSRPDPWRRPGNCRQP